MRKVGKEGRTVTAKYLVVGASGQTGRELVRRLRESGRDVVGTYARHPVDGGERLDLADGAQIDALVRRVRPKFILNPGGITDVDSCEREPAVAQAVNADGPGRLAAAARDVGAFLVHFSTDYVFDGAAGPYAESAAPNPISAYGRSKLDGERAVASSGARHSILRTCVVFSHTLGHANFFMQVYGRLSRGERYTPFSDQFVTPTYAPALAQAALEIADRELAGVVHVAGADWVSRFEFCRRVARRFGLREDLLEARLTAQVRLLAHRPLKAGLAVRRDLKTPVLGLDAAFADIAARIKHGQP